MSYLPEFGGVNCHSPLTPHPVRLWSILQVANPNLTNYRHFYLFLLDPVIISHAFLPYTAIISTSSVTKLTVLMEIVTGPCHTVNITIEQKYQSRVSRIISAAFYGQRLTQNNILFTEFIGFCCKRFIQRSRT